MRAPDNAGYLFTQPFLVGLADVFVPSPSDGDTLIYSTSTGKWTAGAPASSTGSGPGSSGIWKPAMLFYLLNLTEDE